MQKITKRKLNSTGKANKFETCVQLPWRIDKPVRLDDIDLLLHRNCWIFQSSSCNKKFPSNYCRDFSMKKQIAVRMKTKMKNKKLRMKEWFLCNTGQRKYQAKKEFTNWTELLSLTLIESVQLILSRKWLKHI